MNKKLVQRALPMLVLAALAGCSTTHAVANTDPRDPFEPMNRVLFDVNESIDDAIGRPLVHGYVRVTPAVVRAGISNFYWNAKYPVTIVNDALQGKFADTGVGLARFMLNSTLGLGGLLDPATGIGLARHDEDFGQTLGKWGVPEGPYLLLPGLGPYTLLEAMGSVVDRRAELHEYIEDDSTRWEVWAGQKFDKRARLMQVDRVVQRSGDPYTFVRNSYLRRRHYQTMDGNVAPEEVELEADELSDPAQSDPAQGDPAQGDPATDSAKTPPR